ncbi:MAG: hypothetical protein HY747_10395 [Elusimicrobia bacterium]|nr:hypothetical protein [Elusimicrobiota bacterium]
MACRLLLAERADQVQFFIDKGLAANGAWVALGPSAMDCLDKKGIAYKLCEELYKAEELGAICEEGHRQVEKLCGWLDEQMHEEHPSLENWGMRPFLFHIFPLTMLFDGLRSRIFKLKKILQAFPHSEPCLCREPGYPWGSYDLCFSMEENLWGILASLPGWKNPIKIFPMSGRKLQSRGKKSAFAAGTILKPAISWVKQNSILLYTLWRSLRDRDYQASACLALPTFHGALLVMGETGQWRPTFAGFRTHGRRLLFATPDYFISGEKPPDEGNASALLRKLEFYQDMKAYFKFDGISFYPMLKDRLAWIAGVSPGRFSLIMRRVETSKKRYRLKAVLTASASTATEHAINQAARIHGLPVFVWQHGFVGYDDAGRISQLFDYKDRMTADKTFVYGTGVEKAYLSYGRPFESEVVSIGSASLDAILPLREKGNGSKKNASGLNRITILYATTNYFQNHWYYGMPPGWSDCLFYRDQLKIMEVLSRLAKNSDIEIIVKLSPSRQYEDPPWVNRFLNTKNMRIAKEGQFTDLLIQASAVILDCPTTTMLETLAAGRPLFVLLKHWLFAGEARQMLDRRAVGALEVEPLAASLESYIESGIYPRDINNDEYLKAYGTYLHDCSSAIRAFQVISTAIGA